MPIYGRKIILLLSVLLSFGHGKLYIWTHWYYVNGHLLNHSLVLLHSLYFEAALSVGQQWIYEIFPFSLQLIFLLRILSHCKKNEWYCVLPVKEELFVPNIHVKVPFQFRSYCLNENYIKTHEKWLTLATMKANPSFDVENG